VRAYSRAQVLLGFPHPRTVRARPKSIIGHIVQNGNGSESVRGQQPCKNSRSSIFSSEVDGENFCFEKFSCSLKSRGEKPARFLPGPSSRRYSASARRLRAKSQVPPPGPSPLSLWGWHDVNYSSLLHLVFMISRFPKVKPAPRREVIQKSTNTFTRIVIQVVFDM
jgi:hypothetical protein